jgi:molecular chaperone Hsp33
VNGIVEKYITTDGTVRVSTVIATEVVEQAREIHKSYPVATAALGRALIGAGLLATFLKEKGRIALYFKGNGPLGNLFAEGDSDGGVRGYVTNPNIHVPSKDGKLHVGAAVGTGMLSVATSLPFEKHPYTGTVALQSGEIGEDIAYYLYQSQQVPSIVALGVFVEPNNSVSAAGGTILEVMPGASEATLRKLEERVKVIRPVTELIRANATTADLAYELLEDFQFRKLDETSDPECRLEYRCTCNMQRVERSLLLTGPVELGEMVSDAKEAEVTCDFCGRKYSVDIDTLKALANIAKREAD